MNTTAHTTREARREEIRNMKRLDVCAAYFRAEYGNTVDDALIAEVIRELTIPQIHAIVDSVIDQPHLIER